MNRKIIIYKAIFFLCMPLLTFGQIGNNKPEQAGMCRDTVISEDIKTGSNADLHFFGGPPSYLRFFNINLKPLLSANKIPDGNISIAVHLDTSGLMTGVRFLKRLDAEESVNSEILYAVKRIKKWEPFCYFDVRQNEIVCEHIDIYVKLIFRRGKIYLPN